MFSFSLFPTTRNLFLSLLYLFIHSVPQKVTQFLIKQSLSPIFLPMSYSPPRPWPQYLHRCPTHTAWAPTLMHGCCCHYLYLPPGCSHHLDLSLHDPWWVSSPTPTQRQSPPLFWALMLLVRLSTRPLDPLKHHLSPKSRRTFTSQF